MEPSQPPGVDARSLAGESNPNPEATGAGAGAARAAEADNVDQTETAASADPIAPVGPSLASSAAPEPGAEIPEPLPPASPVSADDGARHRADTGERATSQNPTEPPAGEVTSEMFEGLRENLERPGPAPSTQERGETDRLDRTPIGASEPGGRRIAGMVGQVNGQAIYAHHVLEPMDEQLRAHGQRLSRNEFRRRVAPLIHERLSEIVQNALILGEAQRDLSERERQGLKVIMQRVREDLVRKYGRGSPAVADRVLRDRTGQGLEQTLEDRRQALVVERFMQQQLHPRVNVTLRDMERYYHDHYDQFNPSATRTLRLIRAAGPSEAQTIQRRLDAGEPFEQVAGDEQLNAYRPRDGGLMADAPGDEVFGHEPLNAAMRELGEGEQAGPIEAGGEQWFLKIEQINQPERKTFREAQRDIEHRLRLQQLNRLGNEYYQQLLQRGSYNSMEQMGSDLLDIAVNRYAAAETGE